jgi:hypothetical protein
LDIKPVFREFQAKTEIKHCVDCRPDEGLLEIDHQKSFGCEL